MRDTFGKRARKQQVVTGPMTLNATVTGEDGQHAIQMKGRAVATSQTAVDPRKGPESALWKVCIVRENADHSDPFLQDLPYSNMRGLLLTMQFNALGREIDTSNPAVEDLRFAESNRQAFPTNNILHHLG